MSVKIGIDSFAAILPESSSGKTPEPVDRIATCPQRLIGLLGNEVAPVVRRAISKERTDG